MSPAAANTSTFAVPRPQADRLRKLAKISGRPAGTILAEIIDNACKTAGLEVTSTVSLEQRDEANRFLVKLFDLLGDGAYIVELPGETIRTLAEALQQAADLGSSMINLDDHFFEVRRQGTGIILEIDEKKMSDPEACKSFKRTSMTQEVAHKVAKGLLSGLNSFI